VQYRVDCPDDVFQDEDAKYTTPKKTRNSPLDTTVVQTAENGWDEQSSENPKMVMSIDS
jgi:hypothetical protein